VIGLIGDERTNERTKEVLVVFVLVIMFGTEPLLLLYSTTVGKLEF